MRDAWKARPCIQLTDLFLGKLKAMLLIEYRIKLPLNLNQYQVAHLYTIMEMSKEFTSLGEGVEILENVPCDYACLPKPDHSRKGVGDVQRTSKRYHIPSTLAEVAGLPDCILAESAFNEFPHSKTIIIAEAGAKGEFTIDTICKKIDEENNIFKLPQVILDKCSVVDIDVVNDSLPDVLHKDEEDPKIVLGLKSDWHRSLIPGQSMIVHKLVSVNSGETKKKTKEVVNTLVMDTLRKMFTLFHRKLLCSQDRWKGLNMADIRTMENETKDVLDRKRGDD